MGNQQTFRRNNNACPRGCETGRNGYCACPKPNAKERSTCPEECIAKRDQNGNLVRENGQIVCDCSCRGCRSLRDEKGNRIPGACDCSSSPYQSNRNCRSFKNEKDELVSVCSKSELIVTKI